MKNKVMFFDFDGTLSRRKIPLYPGIFKTCFSNKTSLLNLLSALSKNYKNFDSDFYLNYYNFLFELFNKLENNEENLLYGADEVNFNPGVVSFFKDVSKMKGVKSYVLTSGIENYVKKTKISPYVDGVYGTRYEIKNDVIKPTFILTDKQKPKIISSIVSDEDEMFYVGDGLTDAKAFSYVKEKGGKTFLVGASKRGARELKDVVDHYYFDADFTKKGKLYGHLMGR